MSKVCVRWSTDNNVLMCLWFKREELLNLGLENLPRFLFAAFSAGSGDPMF